MSNLNAKWHRKRHQFSHIQAASILQVPEFEALIKALTLETPPQASNTHSATTLVLKKRQSDAETGRNRFSREICDQSMHYQKL